MKNEKLFATYMILLLSFYQPVCLSAMAISSKVVRSLGVQIELVFVRVDDIRILPVGKEKTDIIVIGQQKKMNESWRVQVFEVRNDTLSLKWDSEMLKGIEFDMTGPDTIKITPLDGDYLLNIESCAAHACFDGIHGFLIYSGSTGNAWSAKVATIAGEHGKTAKYDVLWSQSNDTSVEGRNARETLKKAICQSTALSDTAKLPFPCR